MRAHDFRLFLDRFDDLNPAQIEDAQIEDARTKTRDVQRKSEAPTEIESRTKREHKCPHCGDEQRQKWGRTRTDVQIYRCGGSHKTYCGRTGSRTGRIHRPDLFLEVIRDMLGTRVPSSLRQLANRLGLDKHTVWRWRMIILTGMKGSSSDAFNGIIEADEAFQRESRKGSREWVRHLRDPANHPRPPRLCWHEYGKKGVPMMRGLSCWQLPILPFRGAASKYLAGYLDWFGARQTGLTPAAVFRAT